MAGRNLYPQGRSTLLKDAAGTARPCVFISHRSEDKSVARAIAKAVKDLELDVYFDELDQDLGLAAASANDRAIAQCIERGLDRSTHLLGIITEHALDSWWVPYEIGGATGRRRAVAHLIDKQVSRTPSYLTLGTIIRTVEELRSWATSMFAPTLTEHRMAKQANLDVVRTVLRA